MIRIALWGLCGVALVAGWGAADVAHAQAPTKPRLLNPFSVRFTAPRLTPAAAFRANSESPFAVFQASTAGAAAPTPAPVVSAPVTLASSGRPVYRPPVRSPFRPPPRGPFIIP